MNHAECVYCIMWQPERMWSRSAEHPGSKARERTLLRGGATRPDSSLNLGRLCMAPSAYTGPNCERPLFCSQWKAVMGRPQKRDPFVPDTVCVCVCVHEWDGGVERVCLVQTLKTSVLQHTRPSKTCLIWSTGVYVCVCVCVCGHRITYTWAKYKKIKILTCLLSWETCNIKQNNYQYLTEVNRKN